VAAERVGKGKERGVEAGFKRTGLPEHQDIILATPLDYPLTKIIMKIFRLTNLVVIDKECQKC
jgi:hypothetical protein